MAKEIPPLSLSAYNRLFQDIAAMKKQEWLITNYALLIFGAMFWLAPKLPKGPLVAATVIAVSFIYAIFLIRINQINIGKARASAKMLERRYAEGSNELHMLGTEAASSDWSRDWPFVIGLIGALLVGAALVIWSLFDAVSCSNG
jgi:hypothetical protein